tara:strand:- start:112504 stop:113289 length:786 start_codon:yes stop_codon:yes gene_type:complete
MKKIMNFKTTNTLVLVILSLFSVSAFAQRGGAPAGPPPSAQQAAAFDMTGYWVSVVTEDWRWRMLVAEPGDVENGIPLSPAGRALAEAWRPDDNELESCLVFGGAGIMRYPGRLHISWEDEETLRVDFSAGEQSRLLHFNAAADSTAMTPSLQGYTTANWYKERQTRGLGFGGPVRSFEGGNLRSVTRNLRPAFLQRNGIPYSDQTSIEDSYKVIDAPNGDRWLIITSVVTDPVNLQQKWITSTNFKYEENGDNWDPIACR